MTRNKQWSLDYEKVDSNVWEFRSIRGFATITRESDGWKVTGEKKLPRYDGRPLFAGSYCFGQPTIVNGVEIDSATEITTDSFDLDPPVFPPGKYELTGFTTFKAAKDYAWTRVALIPTVTPFEIAVKHDTAEGLRDWTLLQKNLEAYIAEKCNDAFKTALATRRQEKPDVELIDLLDRRHQQELHFFYHKIVVCRWKPKGATPVVDSGTKGSTDHSSDE